MSGWMEWVAALGRSTLEVVWEPLLIWTALALALLGALQSLRNLHPAIQEKARSALLLTLPISVLLALVGRDGWLPIPQQPLPILEWIATYGPATTAVGRPDVPTAGNIADPGRGLPITFWWGLASLLALGVTAILTIKTGVDSIALGRLRRRLRFVHPADLGIGQSVTSELGVRRARLRFAIASDDVVPLTYGVLHPVVVVPSRLLSDRKALRIAIVHEVTHVLRRDALSQMLEHLATLIFAIHPLVHVLREQAQGYREMACDAEVLSRVRCHPRDYAAVLLRLADLTGGDRAPALGVVGTFTHLRKRIIAMSQRSHEPNRLHRARRVGSALGLCVALGATLLIACADVVGDPKAEDSALRGAVTFRHDSFEAALEDARENHDGRLLVYLYGSDPAVSRRVERYLFGNREYSDFLNARFGRYALPVDSPEGLRIMEAYNVTSHTQVPLLLLAGDANRAVLMTTLGEIDSAEIAMEKMRQVLDAVGLDPAGLRLRVHVPVHLWLAVDRLQSFVESGSITPGAARMLKAALVRAEIRRGG